MTAAIVTAADLLDAAADLIAERGLAFGDYAGKNGCLCVRGAFHVAAGRDAFWCDLEEGDHCLCVEPSQLIADYLGLDLTVDDGDGFISIEPVTDAVSRWNDADSMTAGEVVDTLRAVARLERSRGGAA